MLCHVPRVVSPVHRLGPKVPSPRGDNDYCGADPGNSGLLASLEGAYELLLEAPKTGAVTLTSDERLEVGQRLAAIKEIRTARKR